MLGNGILTPYLTHFRELNEKSVPNVIKKVKFYVLFVVLFDPNFGVLLHRTRAVPVLYSSRGRIMTTLTPGSPLL